LGKPPAPSWWPEAVGQANTGLNRSKSMKQLDLAAYKKRAQAEMDWLAQEEKSQR